VLEGNGTEMYDPGVQAQIQSSLFLEPGAFLYFAYPPYTAIPYAGLAALPYGVAFVLHGLLSILALWGAVRLARPLLPRLLRSREDEFVALAVLLGTYPILRSVVGGQNTAFTILLAVIVWHAAENERPAIAGLALAGLLYKPQYGLLLMLVVLAARRFRIIAWWAGGAIVVYSLGMLMLGAAWPRVWLDQVASFNEENLRVNGHLMVSAMGWFGNLADREVVGISLGLAVAALVGVVAAMTAWRLDVGRMSMAVALPALVIASPSALYYDAGLAIGTMGVGLDRGKRGARIAALMIVTTSWTQPAAETLGWSPLFPWLVGLFGWSLVMLFSDQHIGRAH
jgi:alpha-1,2-mannosyltransferase